MYLYLSGNLQLRSLRTKMCSCTKLGDLVSGNTGFTLDSSATLHLTLLCVSQVDTSANLLYS